MAAKFHISPQDQVARLCDAPIRGCSYGISEDGHLNHEEAIAHNAKVAQGKNPTVQTLNKKSSAMRAEKARSMGWKSVDTDKAFSKGQDFAAKLKADGYKVVDADGKAFPNINMATPKAKKATVARNIAPRTINASASAIDNLRKGKDFTLAGRDGSSHTINKTDKGYQSVSTLKDGTRQVFPQMASFSFSSN